MGNVPHGLGRHKLLQRLPPESGFGGNDGKLVASWRNSAVIRVGTPTITVWFGRTTLFVVSRKFGDRPEEPLLRLQLLNFQSFSIAAIGEDGLHRLTIGALSLSPEGSSVGEIP